VYKVLLSIRECLPGVSTCIGGQGGVHCFDEFQKLPMPVTALTLAKDLAGRHIRSGK
jgi:hypothetical protein